MKKVVGAILIVMAISVGLTIYTEGVDQAYGGIFSRFASKPSKQGQNQSDLERRLDRRVGQSSDAFEAPTQTNYKKLVDDVRARTENAMRQAEERLERRLPD